MTRATRRSSDVQRDREVCKLVHQLAQRLGAHVRRVADELGLTPGQVVALRELTEPITAHELAHRMVCEPSNATFVLDRLERQGLIERRPHPTDRRAKQIVLTPAGRSSQADVLHRLGIEPPLAALTTTQHETLRDLLKVLSAES